MKQRLEELRNSFKDIDSLLVMNKENRFYLSGFTGSSGALVIGTEKAILVTDFRYLEQASLESPGYEVFRATDSYAEAIAEATQKVKATCLGCEGNYLTCKQLEEIKEKIDSSIEIKLIYGMVERLREVKDDEEIKAIEESAGLTDQTFGKILEMIKPGLKERELSLELEFFIRLAGADRVPFPIIFASGPRGALPHGVASERALAVGDMVTMDFGAVLANYCSDLSRTVVLGKPSPKQEELYTIVLEAQLAGIAAIKPGIQAREVDSKVRKIIEDYGYGENFGHSTGHGLGLSIHEAPGLSSKDETVLKAGMVVTVEPGIYLPGWGGIRIEDTVLVTENGCRVLTKSPKDRLIVCN